MKNEGSFKYVNLDYLHELSGNDADFEKVMMEQFLMQTPAELEQLESAINANDFVNIKKVAHSLKSTVGYMGLAEELHPYLQRIEKAAVDNDAQTIRDNFGHVKMVSEEAVKEITIMSQNA